MNHHNKPKIASDTEEIFYKTITSALCKIFEQGKNRKRHYLNLINQGI